MSFHHQEIETKWQAYWEKHKTFQTNTHSDKEKRYYLDMFPYPSGSGLHVGHPEGYTATDIISRMDRMKGYEVLHPMGWDAFGLPAEQYAIDTGNSPQAFTRANSEIFKRQIKELGFSYDWDREISTIDPEYYKWTQWIFTKLYENGLAYIDEVPVNWCPALGTVLANEEVIDGKSERGDHPVVRKPMRQWMLRITAYADRLLEDLEDLDWPESLKEMQRNWIDRSEGAEVSFPIEGVDGLEFTAFTTRPDTLFGATYAVLSPEHPLVEKIVQPEQQAVVDKYVADVQTKSELERTDLSKAKTGVFTGSYAINPVNDEKMPVWIADYVLMGYGSGAIMAVPAHDERDFEFATKYSLPIVEVVAGGDIQKEAYVDDGAHINSDFLNRLGNDEAIQKMIEWLENNNKGTRKVTYRLRDWLFARQRYWGEPIPIIHWEDGTMTAVPEEDLPVELPDVDRVTPTGTGESPLANTDWVNVVDPETGMKGRRETNTMPQWAGSCWYYLRFIDPNNTETLADPKAMEKWLPVDMYIGGAEHAVLHLLYARFWHKFLYDIDVVPTKEPFMKLFNQGMIHGEGNEKMSKSKGNVINPDDIVSSHGADTLRLYEMFMGPLEADVAWSTNGLEGARRFLDRVWRLIIDEDGSVSSEITAVKEEASLEKVFHETVKKVSGDYEKLHFNTAISQMMVFVNEAYKVNTLPKGYVEDFVKLLYPITPHLCEELWERLGHTTTITYEKWPEYDETKLVSEEIEVVLQVMGKMRAKIMVPADTAKEDLEKIALENETIQSWIKDKTVRKVIVVPGKLVNIVAN